MLRSAEGSHLGSAVATEDIVGGSLRIRNIPSGKYWVDFANVPLGFYPASQVRLGPQDGTSAPLIIREGDKSPLDIALSDRTATLSGVVETAKGAPVSISQVVLSSLLRLSSRESRGWSKARFRIPPARSNLRTSRPGSTSS